MADYELRLHCLPDQAPVVTSVKLSEGWSKTTKDRCWHASAFNTSGELTSEIVSRSYPEDCIALPEPGIAAALVLGVIVLLLFWRERKNL